MITIQSDKEEILNAVSEVFTELLELYDRIGHNWINHVTSESGWTASQLLDHVSKSTNAIASALMEDGSIPHRIVIERVPELQDTFLNFAVKMETPKELAPDEGPFNKEEVTDKLKIALEDLEKEAKHTNLDGIVEDLPLGAATKWELLHFEYYHTLRHLQQLKRICGAIQFQTDHR